MRHASLVTVTCALMLMSCAGEQAANDSTNQGQTDMPNEAAAGGTPSSDPRVSVLSNEYAEVFRITLAPGQALPPHTSGARTVYALSDYTIRLTQDGQPTEQAWTAGQAHFHTAGEHTAENTGATEARFVVVARTAQPLATSAAAVSPDPATGSGPMQLLLDTDDVIVAEFRLAPGASLPPHRGLARVVYSLNDYTIDYASNNAPVQSQSFTAGEAHWHDADEHSITNSGSTEARFLIVQFKR